MVLSHHCLFAPQRTKQEDWPSEGEPRDSDFRLLWSCPGNNVTWHETSGGDSQGVTQRRMHHFTPSSAPPPPTQALLLIFLPPVTFLCMSRPHSWSTSMGFSFSCSYASFCKPSGSADVHQVHRLPGLPQCLTWSSIPILNLDISNDALMNIFMHTAFFHTLDKFLKIDTQK